MIIKSNQDETIDTDMKIEDVTSYGDMINYLIIKSVKNIVRYTDYTYDDIFKEDYSFDSFFHSISKNYSLPRLEDYDDVEYIRTQLKLQKTKLIRQTEYNIYEMLD